MYFLNETLQMLVSCYMGPTSYETLLKITQSFHPNMSESQVEKHTLDRVCYFVVNGFIKYNDHKQIETTVKGDFKAEEILNKMKTLSQKAR